MNYHRDPPFADSGMTAVTLLQPSSYDLKLLISVVITIVTCLALAFLHARLHSIKRELWETFVYLTPSTVIYVMEYPSRRKWRGGQVNVGFKRSDFGNQQAKSEALQRALGFDNSISSVVRHARRLSGLDHVLGSSAIAPAGLGNWDNSCYQNSIIQSLASLSSFDDHLALNMQYMSEDDSMSTHDALRDIIGRLNNLDNEGKRLWTPLALKSMNSWQQQDAQEYFSRIVDVVDKEVSKVATERITKLGFRYERDAGRIPKACQYNPFQGSLAQRVGCTLCGYTEGLSLLPFTCITVNLGTQREYDIRDCLDEYTALESIEGVECIKCTILRTKSSLEHFLLNMDTHDAAQPSVQAESNPVASLRKTVTERLQVIKEVCEGGDFSDSGLYKRCTISAKSKVSSIKSKQAVIARAPKDLVIHVNRSIFDLSGVQRKNHARVRFPLDLQLDRWSLGSNCLATDEGLLENWNTSPTESMLPEAGAERLEAGKLCKLRAVITHYGGHENGHYIAYRKRSSNLKQSDRTHAEKPDESWFCFSDDVVFPVSEDHVLAQGGVFMLFYEATDHAGSTGNVPASSPIEECAATAAHLTPSIFHDDGDAQLSTTGNLETHKIEVDSAQAVHTVVSSSDVKPTLKSFRSTIMSPSPEEPEVDSNVVVQTEPAKRPSVASVMRTSGALSPRSRKGRQSSNISIHSPSFVIAS